MIRLRPTSLIATLLAPLLVAGLTLTAAPSLAAVSTDPGAEGQAKVTGGSDKAARVSLQRVQRLLTPEGTQTTGVDLTLALRELAVRRDALSGADREAADALFRRPTNSSGDGTLAYDRPEATPLCDGDICVHYVSTGPDAPRALDADANGYPDFVDTTLAVLGQVHDSYLAAGYREPKADGNRGGDSKIDVYLGNLGNRGIYGYCTSDEPSSKANKNRFDRWAYCALDNDFRASEFPTNTPVENLEVTVAHEYFHATQFAYDYYEDAWLLEATAAWVEDEVYDDVDDNLQYLSQSQLRRPGTSLDTFNPATGFHYGTWSFFRFLTEKYRTKQGELPRLVLDLFKTLDGAPGGADHYSWQGLNTVLKKKHTTGAAQLAAYAAANRRPGSSYAEGKANHYPAAPLQGRARLGSGVTKTKTFGVKLDHLTTATYRLSPAKTSKRTKLRITVDLAPKSRGSVAIATVLLTTGKTKTYTIKLDRAGNGGVSVPFGTARVRFVEPTLVNGSGRFDCYERSEFSCQGSPKDQHVLEEFSAKLIRRP